MRLRDLIEALREIAAAPSPRPAFAPAPAARTVAAPLALPRRAPGRTPASRALRSAAPAPRKRLP